MAPLLAALLLAAPAPVTPAAAPAAQPPVVLSEVAQVGALCAALERTDLLRPKGDPGQQVAARSRHEAERAEAIARSYRVELPSKGFAFGHVRTGRDEVELDGDRPLRGIEDALALDLAGIDDVAFRATAAQLAGWSALKKAGGLRLAVVFRPEGERCAGSAAARSWRLAGRPLSWQLLDEKGAVLAAADEDGNPAGPQPAPGAPAASAGPRSIAVERLSLEVDGADESKARVTGAQAALDQCAAAARSSGTLVVAFALAAGRIRDPQVVMDAARDEQAAACVARALTGAAIEGAGQASGRGTLTLSLQ